MMARYSLFLDVYSWDLVEILKVGAVLALCKRIIRFIHKEVPNITIIERVTVIENK